MTTESKPINWVEYKPRELKITRKRAPKFDDFMALVLGMDQEIESSPFWRGDLYNKGLDWFDEELVDQLFGPETSWKTWQNNASVCGRIPPNEYDSKGKVITASRRREGPHATYSHHAEVAYLDPEDFAENKKLDAAIKKLDASGLQSYYLDLSIENMLVRNQLRAKIKFDKGEGPDPLGDKVEFVKGTALQRLEKLSAKMENIIEDLPEGWDPEARYVENARHQVELAIESARNRMIGKPANKATNAVIEIDDPIQEVEA